MSQPPALPGRRECPLDPPQQLGDLRRERPVARVRLWNDDEAWLVTRHDLARQVLQDRRFSADATNPSFPRLSPGLLVGAERAGRRSFSRMDEPEHGTLRRMVAQPFSTRSVELRRAEIETVVADLLDQIVHKGPPADLVRDFALPVPTQMICHLLGVPYTDHAFFQDRTATAIVARDATAEQSRTARAEVYAYLDDLVAAKERDPGDDLIGDLVRRQVREGRLSHDDVVTMAWLLLVAGHETTANMLALSLLTLLTHDHLRAAMLADPAVVPRAVEELLRYHSVLKDGVPRVATEDVTIGGTLIRAGDGVIISLPAANRDESVFPAPDTVDFDRPNAHQHVAFGHGLHQCLGGTLANLELQIALPAVLRRLPGARLAVPLREIPFRDDMSVHGVHALPVTW
ncbi:cytochrome P450 [Dactylosporangium sp. CA-052675]|uniref:cytochrome P450 n=1 Tax=Dactylosporangium sp. CA-052675 TaxID=3239927 RepID=UPI003D925189